MSRRVRTVVATEILLVLGLLAFVGVAWLIEHLASLDQPLRLSPLTAFIMSALPALLWLAYFYSQDRHEPEPKHFVLGVYLLGFFVAGPVAEFAVSHLAPPTPFDTGGLGPLSAQRIVYALMIVGLAQELSKYLVVRYTIYLSPELDEPLDGIIYMSAAGIGFATWVNYHYFKGLQHSVFLASGAAHAVVTTLAHACFAGVMGYALGRAKFSPVSATLRSLILFAGLFTAALFNGQFRLVQSAVATSGIHVQPWRGLAYAAGFAVAVFFVTSLLMRRLLRASPHRPELEAP